MDTKTIAFLPYDEQSTFRMQDSTGHVIHFHCQSIKNEEHEYDNCGDCCPIDYEETRKIVLVSDSPFINLSLILMQAGNGNRRFTPTFEPILKADQYYWNEVAVNFCEDTTTSPFCIDTMHVGGRQFHHVLQLELQQQLYYQTPPFPPIIWYAPYIGIVRLRLPTGEIWDILP